MIWFYDMLLRSSKGYVSIWVLTTFRWSEIQDCILLQFEKVTSSLLEMTSVCGYEGIVYTTYGLNVFHNSDSVLFDYFNSSV